MRLLQRILTSFDGLHYPQEYLCLARETFEPTLRVYLVRGQRILKDITDSHVFAGYSPLVFVLWFAHAEGGEDRIKAQVIFSERRLKSNDNIDEKGAIAKLSLNRIRTYETPDKVFSYYEGIHGEHRLLPAFHQRMIGLKNRLYNKASGNVFLHDNLYKQVQIAYSVPRTISLVTVGQDGLFNLFPTDLHGKTGAGYYISSLRHGGLACQQVVNSGKILVCQVDASAFRMVYSLGRNHMQPLKSRDQFPFGKSNSADFGLPIPDNAMHYHELEVLEAFDHGIHKLLFYRIVSERALASHPATLAHVHNVYATWRHNNGLSGNYLLR
ncbi:MAG: hypothetical protein H7Y42_16080 [Chitinophagaceae bacterium]|nr:hypothetical protein [Chitinophagaceae bacterium]